MWLCLSGISFPYPQHGGMGENSYPGSFQLSGSVVQGFPLYIPLAKVVEHVITGEEGEKPLEATLAGALCTGPARARSVPGGQGRGYISSSAGRHRPKGFPIWLLHTRQEASSAERPSLLHLPTTPVKSTHTPRAPSDISIGRHLVWGGGERHSGGKAFCNILGVSPVLRPKAMNDSRCVPVPTMGVRLQDT